VPNDQCDAPLSGEPYLKTGFNSPQKQAAKLRPLDFQRKKKLTSSGDYFVDAQTFIQSSGKAKPRVGRATRQPVPMNGARASARNRASSAVTATTVC